MVLLFAIFILLSGLYAVYDIFYSSYFDKLTYQVHAWLGRGAPTTITEFFLNGFPNINTIIGSILISTQILELLKRINGDKNNAEEEKNSSHIFAQMNLKENLCRLVSKTLYKSSSINENKSEKSYIYIFRNFDNIQHKSTITE